MGVRLLLLGVMFGFFSANANIGDSVVLPMEEVPRYHDALSLAYDKQRADRQGFNCATQTANDLGDFVSVPTTSSNGYYYVRDVIARFLSNRLHHNRYDNGTRSYNYTVVKGRNSGNQPVLIATLIVYDQGIETLREEIQFISTPDDKEILGLKKTHWKIYLINTANLRDPNLQKVLRISELTTCERYYSQKQQQYQQPSYNFQRPRAVPTDTMQNAGGG